eukprot:CAMPEP_0201591908 /NCGR_PEP_ID=MMETSP0190_2-20130828/189946_1 /ASSEMBLY_ACC=CAM_ASM_000263 /TAXON_ID=37353 /ORGANISM="Rosalina sp." /LENGTH=333 /DNA_ID=CAMNT_0048050433 /DNA_START=605 /DNA_END=1603 /DNA_ORIENTATION=-
MTCNDAVSGNVSEYDPVHYYKFSITEDTYFPIRIDFGGGDPNLEFYHQFDFVNDTEADSNDTEIDFNDSYANVSYTYDKYMYLIKSTNDGSDYDVINYQADYYYPLTFELEDSGIYQYGDYYIVLQADGVYKNSVTKYDVSITCSPPPTAQPTTSPPTDAPTYSPTVSPTEPPKFETHVVAGVVFGVMGFFLFSFICYYIYRLVNYCNNKDKPNSKQPIAREDTESSEHDIDVDEHQDVNVDPEDPTHEQNALAKEKDPEIIDVFEQIIKVCEDKEQFDIFQVWAVRCYDAESRKVTGMKPFGKFGYDLEIIKLSPLDGTIFIAIIVGLTQTW